MADYQPLDAADFKLVEAARAVLRARYLPERHTVGAAVRCGSGKVYTGVNIRTCGYGPCAEATAIGTAFTAGERDVLSVVAVGKRGEEYPVLSPCGNCRQLIVNYAPGATLIFMSPAGVRKTEARNLLPGAYLSFE